MRNLRPRLIPPGSRRDSVTRRLLGAARLLTVAAVASLFMPGDGSTPTVSAAPATSPTTLPSAAGPSAGVSAEVVEALKGLKSAAPADRQKIYAVLSEKGDARVIPALRAFLGGQLQLRDDRLLLYGQVQESAEDGRMVRYFPVFDAVTGDPIPGPDGKPLVEKINLSAAFRAPLTFGQKEPVLDLIATLSLLHPDAEVRLASIRDAGERAGRAFPDAADEERVTTALRQYLTLAKPPAAAPATTQPAVAADPAEQALLAAVEGALADKPVGLLAPVPGEGAIGTVTAALSTVTATDKATKGTDAATLPAGDRKPVVARQRLADELSKYKDRLDALKKNTEDLPKYAAAFKRQLAAEPDGPFAPALREAAAQTDAALGDKPTRIAAAATLGQYGTSRAENVLRKLYTAATRTGDAELAAAVEPGLRNAEGYQRKVRLVQYTFAGLSTGSIYVLLALGLAIIFGLMGVINMAHGEFMMVGAFTTFVVARWFKESMPGSYDYFPIVAVPASFLVAGLIGLAVEYLVIRHLYGRQTETLLATIGIGLILVQYARYKYGDNVSYAAPRWMQGSMEVAPDLLLNRARLWTIVYCVLCIAVVYLIVNRTKLGLLLRATTQNRQMAAALGVPTRGVDAMTFAFGAGLAGMAGVVVPMIDKINPSMGQDYVVMSFMVVVVGGVGKLAGALIAGLGLGAVGNYLEPALGSIQAFARTSSVLSKVLVLAAIVVFLQWRPSGLFPPKGRVADA